MKNVDYLKQNAIDVETGLELLGDMEMYEETLKDFIEECVSRLPKLVEYKEKLDMQNYAILVHSLKSDSKYLGFNKLTELALDHELKAKINDAQYVSDNFDLLIAEVNNILAIIKNYI